MPTIPNLEAATSVGATDLLPVAIGPRAYKATVAQVLTEGVGSLTGFFRSNQGGRVVRVADRLFVGSAVDNDGANPNVDKDWLTDLINWPVYNATAAMVSQNGQIALSTGSQTADLDSVFANTTQTTIGLAAFGIANNPGTFPDDFFAAFGLYAEGRVYPGTVSTAFAAEFNAINQYGSVVGTSTPYRELYTSGTQALRLASGGGQGLVVHDALAAIAIVDNEAKFGAGIVFSKNSLTGADGTSGFGTALALAKGHTLTWYYDNFSNGAVSTFITSTATQPVASLQFQNDATLFVSPSPSNKILFSVGNTASAVNGIGVVPAITGQAPQISTFGDNTNIDLTLRPKGTGQLNLYGEIFFFYSDAGNQMAALRHTITDTTRFSSLEFADNGPFFFSTGAGTMFGITRVAGAVNYLSVVQATATNAPTLLAVGTDVDVDLKLQPQASGRISIQTPTTTSASVGGASALPGAPAGYATIVVNGTAVKIPYWNP